ncbi:hypothetical protein IAQ61_010515 [Plenodomus lingam]|uniref:uncharacterized protein n=1 Tax=Leptosphaeria maculans TaxID=5022 RepID=UPI0033212985|nr:hypothetical protein IAQ61_010515 [Plenodomus lingam]
MNSKRIFSRSKRQSSGEPYYRTGGLLPIDTKSPRLGEVFEAKTSSQAEIQRPCSLQVALPYDTRYTLSPLLAQYDAAWDRSGSNLQAAFEHILRSPMLCATGCVGPDFLQKPLPSRPRSVSMTSTPELPAELPGSILLENQGYPVDQTSVQPLRVTQASRDTSSVICTTDFHAREKNKLSRLSLVPESLTHAKSVPNLCGQHAAMQARSSLLNVPHRRSRSETDKRRPSRLDLETAPSSMEKKLRGYVPRHSVDAVDVAEALQPSLTNVPGNVSDTTSKMRPSRRKIEFGASATPTPTITHSRHFESLRTTTTNQEGVNSNPSAQLRSSRPLKEFAATGLDAPAGADTTLLTRASVLEVQQENTETIESPQTPIQEDTLETAKIRSSVSQSPFQSAQGNDQRSPPRLRNSPDMENLKRKLSNTRRPETFNRNLLPELNQYKQNNVALQKQIESLMAKLNDSKKRERETRTACEKAEQERVEWKAKADKASKFVESAKALQNTVDHLESRLEIANTERLDAEEQLSNMWADMSPFDTMLTTPCAPITVDLTRAATQDPHTSMSTVFSNASLTSPDQELREFPTLSASVEQIERLQEQSKQKDDHIAELCKEIDELRSRHRQLQVEHDEVILRSEIQADLLQKSRETDAILEQLRKAVLDREAIIADKEKSLRATERQLDLHKLLLRAEIRRHATMKLKSGVDVEALPELTTLVKQEDLDRWISNLNRQFQNEYPTRESTGTPSTHEMEVESLRNEVNFYVREIIYYKLDIRGYKSDIRKLKRITEQLSSYGSRASDLDSETSSLRPAPTPSRSKPTLATPELGNSNTASPIVTGSVSMSPPAGGSCTPTLAKAKPNADVTPAYSARRVDSPRQEMGNENIEAISIVPKDSMAQRKGLEYSERDLEASGERSVKLPLMDSASPQQQDATHSTGESSFKPSTTNETPKRSVSIQHSRSLASSRTCTNPRDRSASLPNVTNDKISSSHQPRPRVGLFGFASASGKPTITVMHDAPINVEDIDLQHTPKADDSVSHKSLHDDMLSSDKGDKTQSTSGYSTLTPSLESRPSVLSSPSIDNGPSSPPSVVTQTANYQPTQCSMAQDTQRKVNVLITRTAFNLFDQDLQHMRTAIPLPKPRKKDKPESGIKRNDSMIYSKPLKSPFFLKDPGSPKRSLSVSSVSGCHNSTSSKPDSGVIYGIGEAI